jgi:hypothetical protein
LPAARKNTLQSPPSSAEKPKVPKQIGHLASITPVSFIGPSSAFTVSSYKTLHHASATLLSAIF